MSGSNENWAAKLGITSAAAMAGMSLVADLLAAQVREEEAEMRLLCVTRPAHLNEVMDEVDRRAAVYAKAWRERSEPPPNRETPRFAALRTVADDVMYGRLG